MRMTGTGSSQLHRRLLLITPQYTENYLQVICITL